VIELPLETDRLRIRLFEPAHDAEPLHELWGDPEAMRFIPGGTKASVEETRERLQAARDDARGGWGFWALEERAGEWAIGGVGLFPLAWEGPEIELAYHVVPSVWGSGYATEAGVALLDAAWRDTDLDHVVAVALPANRASRRVMEKLGMAYEGQVRYREIDAVRYVIERPATLR
jgi:RimJ/RimL family protein N-acetyltransferase